MRRGGWAWCGCGGSLGRGRFGRSRLPGRGFGVFPSTGRRRLYACSPGPLRGSTSFCLLQKSKSCAFPWWAVSLAEGSQSSHGLLSCCCRLFLAYLQQSRRGCPQLFLSKFGRAKWFICPAFFRNLCKPMRLRIVNF